MKQISILELIIVLVVVIILSGLAYCVYQINDLKYKSFYAQKIAGDEKWKNDIAVFLNGNIQAGRLQIPTVTPQPVPPKPEVKK